MKEKFKVVKVRRFNKNAHEVYETWYRDCTIDQAISWFNKRKIEGAAPVYAYCPTNSFDEKSKFSPVHVVERVSI